MSEYVISKMEVSSSPSVVMGIGIPGAGKTTALEKFAEQLEWPRICIDEIRKELVGDEANQSISREAWDISCQRIESLIKNGTSCILDATNVYSESRQKLIKTYREMGALTIGGIIFNTPLQDSLRRDAYRARVVKSETITRMHNALWMTPPTQDEGFDWLAFFDFEANRSDDYHQDYLISLQ